MTRAPEFIKQRRIVLYYPFVDDFTSIAPHYKFFGRRSLKKYGFLVSERLADDGVIHVCWDGSMSAFLPQSVTQWLPVFIVNCLNILEFRLWRHLNCLSSAQAIRVKSNDECHDDVLMCFSYKAAIGKFAARIDTFDRFFATVFHLSHYFILTEKKALNIRRVRNAILAGDSDPTSNPYFQKYFHWYKRRFLVLPFAVGTRFEKRLDMSERKLDCVITGTFHDLRHEKPVHYYSDFMTTTGETTYHPVRRNFFERKDELGEKFVCIASPFRDYAARTGWSGMTGKLAMKQTSYFSTDIVELYNDACFAVVGEEFSGFPGIGALEAAACGAVLIGQPSYYRGLGLVENEHFIGYDGSVEQSLEVIRDVPYKKRRQISEAAAKDISMRFSPPTVFQKWCEILTNL